MNKIQVNPIHNETCQVLIEKVPEINRGLSHCLCAREDLNLHALRHTHLKRACLPIPALAQEQGVL